MTGEWESVTTAVDAFHANASLYALEVPNARYVLFRIDGVIVEISRALFDFFATYGDLPVADRVAKLEAQYGAETAEDAVGAVVELLRQHFLVNEPQPLRNPNPRTAQPGGILIMMTQTCNLACTYCYAGGGTYGGTTKLMTETGALRAIDLMLKRAPDRKEFTVTFFGGEPLLNFRLLLRIVEHCERIGREKRVKFRFSMTTNGTIVTDEIIDFLKRRKFDLMVSFDGEGGAANRPFVDGSSSHEQVTRNLQRLAAAGVRFQIRATITREMVKRETIAELTSFGRKIGREVIMSPASATKNEKLPDTSGLALTEVESERLMELYRETTQCNVDAASGGEVDQLMFDPNKRMVQALMRGTARGMGKCGACLSMAAASTDGDLYPCHRFVGMKEYAIGSLANGVDEERVESFFARAEAANKPNCEACFARQICGGFCFYTLADGNGAFVPPSKRDCDRFRESVGYSISTVLRLRDLPPEQTGRYMGTSVAPAAVG